MANENVTTNGVSVGGESENPMDTLWRTTKEIQTRTNVIVRAEFVLEAKRTFEQMYPESEGFDAAKALSEITGWSPRRVRNDLDLFWGLTPQVRDGLRGSVVASMTRSLRHLARLSKKNQASVLRAVLRAEAHPGATGKTVKNVFKTALARHPLPPKKTKASTPVEGGCEGWFGVWMRSPLFPGLQVRATKIAEDSVVIELRQE